MDGDNGKDKDRTDEPPADGPSGGSAGQPQEETGSSSYDKPGDGEGEDSGKQSPK
ncbi:MAG: hypothetical protein M3285_13230 [Actinomycetota bacterium]|nr:hypothetical protein [Actinomycetota bacterium]